MESLYNNQLATGVDYTKDPKRLLSKRPQIGSSSKSAGLFSGLGTTKFQAASSSSQRENSAKKSYHGYQSSSSSNIEDDSDDEIDCLSSSQKRSPRKGSVDEVIRQAQSTSDALKKMKFKKNSGASEMSHSDTKENGFRERDRSPSSTRLLGDSATSNRASYPPLGKKPAPKKAKARGASPVSIDLDDDEDRWDSPPRGNARPTRTRKAEPVSATPKPKKSKTRDLEKPPSPSTVKAKSKPTIPSFPSLSPLDKHSDAKTSTFPDFSPLSTPQKGKRSARTSFPMPSPLGSPEGGPKANNAFPDLSPLSSQALKGKGKEVHIPSFLQPSGKKRISDDFDEDRSPKRQKGDLDGYFGGTQGADDTTFTLSRDPSKLCPYCDALLPEDPTPVLLRLLKDTAAKSRPDPRPLNPLGRKANLSTFVPVCQRHKFETDILPEAEQNEWPKSIDWASLQGRIQKMKKHLKAIVNDDTLSERQMESVGADGTSNNARLNCVFWNDAVEEAKKGSNVRQQLASFDKSQPGYYGELGSLIIHQVLYDLFPMTGIDASSLQPLTSKLFFERVLVPEVGLRLIMEDKSLSGPSGVTAGLKILRDSAAYGVAMFPDNSGEGGAKSEGHDVGEALAMERATRRRRELEQEGISVAPLKSSRSKPEVASTTTSRKDKRKEENDGPGRIITARSGARPKEKAAAAPKAMQDIDSTGTITVLSSPSVESSVPSLTGPPSSQPSVPSSSTLDLASDSEPEPESPRARKREAARSKPAPALPLIHISSSSSDSDGDFPLTIPPSSSTRSVSNTTASSRSSKEKKPQNPSRIPSAVQPSRSNPNPDQAVALAQALTKSYENNNRHLPLPRVPSGKTTDARNPSAFKEPPLPSKRKEPSQPPSSPIKPRIAREDAVDLRNMTTKRSLSQTKLNPLLKDPTTKAQIEERRKQKAQSQWLLHNSSQESSP